MELARSRAKIEGLLRTSQSIADEKPEVEVRYVPAEIEDAAQSRERMLKNTPAELLPFVERLNGMTGSRSVRNHDDEQ